MPTFTYMVIEHFRNGDPEPVYRRFRDHGRLAPDGRDLVDFEVHEALGSQEAAERVLGNDR